MALTARGPFPDSSPASRLVSSRINLTTSLKNLWISFSLQVPRVGKPVLSRRKESSTSKWSHSQILCSHSNSMKRDILPRDTYPRPNSIIFPCQDSRRKNMAQFIKSIINIKKTWPSMMPSDKPSIKIRASFNRTWRHRQPEIEVILMFRTQISTNIKLI